MNTSSNDNHILSNCANCGKGEEESVALKNCVACKLVKYCNRDCQKAHRSQHKKECKKRAAELHEEALFKPPPPREECPICLMRMPTLHTGYRYMSCCGKIICCGCIHAGAMVGDNKLCPFCRTPAPTSDEEAVEREKKRVELGDHRVIHKLACDYAGGRHGLTQNWDKALELWHLAGELGCAVSYCSIGIAYSNGEGVARDEKMATHYYELAAMGGDVIARHNLGNEELRAGNHGRAMKHYMIAVGSGYHGSLKMILRMHTDGQLTREDYAEALKAYQVHLDEIKSDDRDRAAAVNVRFKYYE